MGVNDKIVALTSDLKELEASVRELNIKLSALYRQRSKEAFGVEVGTVVLHRGKEYRVTFVDACRDYSPGQTTKPWLMGVIKKKDGEWGCLVRHIYNDWALPADQEP